MSDEIESILDLIRVDKRDESNKMKRGENVNGNIVNTISGGSRL